MSDKVQCGGCGAMFDSLPSYGACDTCQNEELYRQQVEQEDNQRLEDFWRGEREAGRA